MKSKFNKPLNTWIEESVPVLKNKLDPKTKKITSIYEMEKMRVKYVHAPKVKYRCPDGEHTFKVTDNARYIFSCTKCPFSRKVYPTTYKFDETTGALIHLLTSRRV